MDTDTLKVFVCYAMSTSTIWYKTCQLPKGSRVSDAVQVSGFEQEFPAIDWKEAGVGIFGHRCGLETQLSDQDRIEIYRPLVFDPKESRRRRAQHRRERLLRGDRPNG